MNPIWDAAQALLALVLDCLDVDCESYARHFVDTVIPVADCSTLAVVPGTARAHSGSCVGRTQLSVDLDIHLIRCCDPLPTLTTAGGYTPPTPAAIEAAAACLFRDAWALYECIVCSACDALGAIHGVTACCDDHTGPPQIIPGRASGGCRSTIVRVPIVVTVCCPVP